LLALIGHSFVSIKSGNVDYFRAILGRFSHRFLEHFFRMDEIIELRGGAAMAIVSGSVIVQDPEIHSGEPVFRGTRVPFQTLLGYLEGGETLDEFLKQYPGVSRENAIAALEEAKSLMLARFGK
jgi:uncharacterized protein (DUF433 family)